MEIKKTIYRYAAHCIRKLKLHRLFKIKNDSRESTNYQLVFFCGKKGIDYLNSSLLSVYLSWNKLPELIIISDGTPIESIKKQLIKWPRKIKFTTWLECAEYFKNNNNESLYNYACKELWGKKMVSVLYCALQYPILYSDTDILWFGNPENFDLNKKPYLKMGEDISNCFSPDMLKVMNDQTSINKIPLNAGLIFANGDFSSHKNWKKICKYLADHPDIRTEQTSFALLNNYFNPDEYWNHQQVLINVKDVYKLGYTGKENPEIFARHYVDKKDITFWKDFTYMCLAKRKYPNSYS